VLPFNVGKHCSKAQTGPSLEPSIRGAPASLVGAPGQLSYYLEILENKLLKKEEE